MRKTVVPILFLLVSGCGTLLLPSTIEVPVTSEPPDARVTVNGQLVSTETPAAVTLDNSESHVVTISKDGYRSGSCMLRSRIKATYVIMDILLTGALGVVIDAVTGGWSVIDNPQCAVVLQPAR